ncbi:hypothetical protein EV182_006977 [Spiromyces aspiralis]|uniref:Uncharacterized protein n=1 Tax=Spiromyces aspiralis TaxID=68401 RepID=A0ACC1H9C2_9FUNG|nr:hypothetical protein EV182_006977 [Spiromyces aspiralis]
MDGEVGEGHLTNITGLELTDSTLWSSSADRTAKGWDLASRKQEMKLIHSRVVKSVLGVPQAGIVVTGDEEGVVYMWSMTTGEIVKEIHAHLDGVIKFVLHKGVLYSASLDATVRQWSIRDILEFPGLKYGPEPVSSDAEDSVREDAAALSRAGGSKSNSIGLTAEEEAELAELISSDDDDDN